MQVCAGMYGVCACVWCGGVCVVCLCECMCVCGVANVSVCAHVCAASASP